VAGKSAEDRKVEAKKRAYEFIAGLPEGRLVLRDVFELTGYDAETMRQNHQTGEINPIASLINQGKRKVWMLIQERLTRQTRILIEIPEEETEPPKKRKADKEESVIAELTEDNQEE